MEIKKLTSENYYDWTGHFSNSFYKAFKSCEFSAIQTYVNGEPGQYKQCFVEGHILENYIFYGADNWCKNLAVYWDKMHKATTKKEKEEGKGPTPYTWVTNIFPMGEMVRNDSFVMSYINQPGNKFQKIYEFELGGALWKCALDIANPSQGWFADLKTTAKHFSETFWVYDHEQRRNVQRKFIDAFDYWTQIGLYSEAFKQNEGKEPTPYLIPVTKTDPPDCCVFDMRSNRYPAILAEIEDFIPHIIEVVEGKKEPKKCGQCADCIKARVNTKAYDANEFCYFELELV